MPWDYTPVIFDGVTGEPVTFNAQVRAKWAEQKAEEEVERICPWCGLLCESVEAELKHEEVCEDG